MTTLEALKAVRELIATPERWTTGAMARDADGAAVGHSSPKAVCYCLYGAIGRACGDWNSDLAMAVHDRIKVAEGDYRDVWEFNDQATHAEVLALIDRAIEAEAAAL